MNVSLRIGRLCTRKILKVQAHTLAFETYETKAGTSRRSILGSPLKGFDVWVAGIDTKREKIGVITVGNKELYGGVEELEDGSKATEIKLIGEARRIDSHLIAVIE